jgi:hypothetical protein
MTFPGLVLLEQIAVRGFALQLIDGYTRAPELQGEVLVNIAGQRSPLKKVESATWVFLDIRPGGYAIAVTPSPVTPYYEAVTIPVNLPLADPLWQAYPDLSLADRSKPLDDPGQPAAYQAQRALATLRPTPQYPFPPDTTLVRGTVVAGGVPLAGATVVRVGDFGGAETDSDGEFVLFFDDVKVLGQAATIRATHPLQAGHTDVQLKLKRGTTVSIQIVMS